MDANTFVELKQRTPFEPFEVVLSSRERYPLRISDRFMIFRRYLLVLIEPERETRLPPDYTTFGYEAIASVEPLPPGKPVALVGS